VASVGLVAGSAAAKGDGITIVSPGAVTVTVNVPLAVIRRVRVGQAAEVRADGGSSAASGRVVSIGLLPTTTGSTTTYPAVVNVPSGGGLFSGSRAQVSLVLDSVSDVLVVPNSALTRLGAGSAAVGVLSRGTVSRVVVTVGAVGALLSQVSSGLVEGQQVVLADRSQAVPANSATVTRRLTGAVGPGGFGAGGSAGGGRVINVNGPPGG
jgi:hypothetical protein